jgi:muconolactone delta-isomerase
VEGRKNVSKFLVIQKQADVTLPQEALRRLLPAQLDYMKRMRQSGRIETSYGFASQKGGVFIVDVASHEELQNMLNGQPMWAYLTTEAYPLNAMETFEKSVMEMLENTGQAVPV